MLHIEYGSLLPIPGKYNVLADIESRRSLGESERIVNCDIFQLATHKVQVTPNIDLFA